MNNESCATISSINYKEVPVNLDGATEAALKKVTSNTSFPKSYTRYAGIKLEASNARKKGDIAKALMLEAHADQLYSKMTGNLKW